MALLDMFDKLDDIVFEPVKAISDWIHEPLRRMEHKRDMQAEEHASDLRIQQMREEEALEEQRNRAAAELEADQRKWNAEIDAVIAEQEDARRDRLVEAIKHYQIELANATRDIVESIGLMSLELRRRANDLVLEKTREYTALQDKAKAQSMAELQEAREMFAETDPETYRILVSDIMSERRSMIETAGKFIAELSADLKRLNQNSDLLMQKGMDAVMSALSPLNTALGTAYSPDQPTLPIADEPTLIECEITEE